MTARAPSFERLDPFGAEVHGIELGGSIDPEVARRLRLALIEFQFLVFRKQPLSPRDQERLTRCFGEPEPGISRRPASHQVTGYPDILYLSNEPGSKTFDYGMGFHSDGLAYARVPHGATLLHCVASPARVGDTLFADQYRAYDVLPSNVRACAHDSYWYLPRIPYSEAPPGKNLAHPIARQHPVSGRYFVFCAPNATELHGRTRADSLEILEAVHECQIRDSGIYRYAWQPHDTVVWENCTLLHSRAGAVDFETHGLRVMRRSATAGAFEAREYDAG